MLGEYGAGIGEHDVAPHPGDQLGSDAPLQGRNLL
jgi:hypothetical protein